MNWSVRTIDEEESLVTRTSRRLRELIAVGHLAPGTRLPAEPDLAGMLNVSRPTLRAGLSELVADHLLIRRRGVGTFVAANAPFMSHGLQQLLGTGEAIRLRGGAPGTTGLHVRHAQADAALADLLQTDLGADVLHISRTRTSDGRPVLHCEEWVPTDVLPTPDALDGFTESDSLYGELADLGLAVTQAIARFHPLLPDEALRSTLGLPVGVPVLQLAQEHYLSADSDRLILYSENSYNTQLIELHAVRNR